MFRPIVHSQGTLCTNSSGAAWVQRFAAQEQPGLTRQWREGGPVPRQEAAKAVRQAAPAVPVSSGLAACHCLPAARERQRAMPASCCCCCSTWHVSRLCAPGCMPSQQRQQCSCPAPLCQTLGRGMISWELPYAACCHCSGVALPLCLLQSPARSLPLECTAFQTWKPADASSGRCRSAEKAALVWLAPLQRWHAVPLGPSLH